MRNVIPVNEAEYYIEEKVNMVGAILEFSIPRKSKGSDYVSILKIVDDSHQYPDPEFSVSIFTSELDHLPFVRSRGDFILLRNVMIKRYEGEVSALYNKRYSSFALFDGSGNVPYQSFPGFCLSDLEKRSLARLRNWYPSARFNDGMSDYLRSLKDITENDYFDIVCKVLDLHENLTNVWILFAWDGTDVPPLSICRKLRDEEENPLPLQIERRRLPLDILRKFHSVGTVLRVNAAEAHEVVGVLSSMVGKWVRIRNMTAKASSGMWQGILTPSSRIRILPEDDCVVEELVRKYDERRVGEQGCLPTWSSPPYHLTVIDRDCEGLPFYTLMDLLCRSQVNVLYKCTVQVVEMFPLQAKDLRTQDGGYKVKLTLEDPTARIHALLSGEEGVKFFENCPNTEALITTMKKLVGSPEYNVREESVYTRCPPWIQCVVYAKDSDACEKRLFHISCTRIVGSSSDV